ncbi:MAG: helix-hairpin-helix domain-containing protein [Paludibacter sp.]
MWKDFFYFSRGQRVGVIVLFVLIALAFTANYFLPYFFPVVDKDDSAFRAEVAAFKKSLVSRDSLRQAEWQRRYEEQQRLYAEKYQNQGSFPVREEKTGPYALFAFDPNTIDSAGFVRLGLKPFIASNILKYRSKGGRFRTAADFGKVYGILPDKLKELEPYISIAEIKTDKKESISAKRTDIIVDLNSADTTLLMQIKGIGRGYAKGIVRFRQSTGGFVSVDQLSEVYGMRPENLEKIRPYCTINQSLIQKIKVNIATAQRLDAHPYLNFYQARAIYELRRNKGKLHDISELRISVGIL